MKELGRRGGLTRPTTKLRKAVREDDELRERARETLRRALAGEDVSKGQLDAARSLFAFRAAAPPHETVPEQQAEGRMHVGLGDILRVAAECKMLSSIGAMEVDAERELAERLKARPGSEQQAALVRAAMVPPVKESEAERATGYPPAPAITDESATNGKAA